MSNKQQIKHIATTQSKLERFAIGFEYDKTLQEVKREMRVRTI